MKDYYSYYTEMIQGMDLPLAYVDMDLWQQNIATNLRRAGNKTVRIASKSVRCPHLLRELFHADSRIQGLMTFSAKETHFLSQKGFDNLLLGYPCMGRNEILLLAGEIQAGKEIIFMVDSEAHLALLQAIAKELQIEMKICWDIDMSSDFLGLHFGVWRSSLRSREDIERFYRETQKYDRLQTVGIMGYEAQVAGVGDNVKGSFFKNKLVRALKRRSEKEYSSLRRFAAEYLLSKGVALAFVNGGGTGSVEWTSEEAVVSEITIGSGFFAPTLFDSYQDFQLQPAAGFALPIVRIPVQGIYTCAGGGYIASGQVGESKQPLPYLPQGCALTKLEGAGEVMTPVLYSGNLEIGAPIYFRHAKAGELCERFETLLLLSNGAVVQAVPTYRGEGGCFL